MYRHWPDSSRSSTPSCWKMSIPFPPKSTSTKAFRGSRCNAFRMDLLFFVFHFQGNKNFLFHKNGHSDSLLKFFFTFYNLLHVQSNGFGANTSLLGVAFLSWDDGILSQRQGWPASPFLWPAEGFPNVKGCGPCKRATEVFLLFEVHRPHPLTVGKSSAGHFRLVEQYFGHPWTSVNSKPKVAHSKYFSPPLVDLDGSNNG